MRTIIVAALLALMATPLFAQEKPLTAHLSAAGWCAVKTGSNDKADTSTDKKAAKPGCDIGMAASLYEWRRLAAVAAIGTDTVGLGGAWIAQQGGEGRPTIAVSFGVVAPYDMTGISVSDWAIAVGATFGIKGKN